MQYNCEFALQAEFITQQVCEHNRPQSGPAKATKQGKSPIFPPNFPNFENFPITGFPEKSVWKEPPPVPVRSKIMACNITGNAMARYEAHSLKISGSITGRRLMTNAPHANKRTNNVLEPDRGKIVACAITGNSHQGYASLPVNNVGRMRDWKFDWFSVFFWLFGNSKISCVCQFRFRSWASITNRNAAQKKTKKSTTRAKTIEDDTVHKDSKADLRGIVEAKKVRFYLITCQERASGTSCPSHRLFLPLNTFLPIFYVHFIL